MIDEILKVLEDLRLISEHDVVDYHVFMTGIDSTTFHVFINRKPTFFIKTSFLSYKGATVEFREHFLYQEFVNQKRAFLLLSENVPEPNECVEYKNLIIFIMKNYDHIPIEGLVYDDPKHAASMFKTFFTKMVNCDELKCSHNRSPFMTYCRELLDNENYKVDTDAADYYINNNEGIIQHGDFSINNIGYWDDVLVILDWEDANKVTLPGFDIFVLVFSIVGMDAARMKGFFNNQDDDLYQIYDVYTSLYNIDKRLFEENIPYFAFIFMNLKEHYSKNVQLKIKNFIQQY